MGKKYFLLAFLVLFILTGHAWAESANSRVRSFSTKMPFAPGEIIVRFNKPHQIAAQSGPSVLSVSGSAADQVEVKKLFTKSKKSDKGTISILSAGSDKVDEPGVYKLTYKNRDDIYSVINVLKKDPDVDYAEPNYLYQACMEPNDPEYPLEWGFSTVGAPAAWDVTKGGDPNIVIAVIDTGVDYNHPDLVDNIWHNPKEVPGNDKDNDGNGYKNDVIGWNFVNVPTTWLATGERSGPDNNPMDFLGHGTHVAGIAAGKANNGKGIAGAAWNCKIMPLRAGYMANDGYGYLELDNIAEAIYYAADNGANVINMSFGIEDYDSQLVKDAINYAYSKGCVMVAAAGNVEPSEAKTPFYPAADDHVIAVAAVQEGDMIAVWNFMALSNYGDFVDVCAPGSNILSTLPNGSYGYESGTSMASPFVAGVAALIKSKYKDLTPDEVEKRLKDTADDVYSVNRQSCLKGNLGAGRVSAKKALGNLSMAITYPRPDSIISGSVVVKGAADMEDFKSYKLEYSSVASPDSWVPIVDGSTKPVDNGVLAVWNVNDPNGQYNLRVTVSNTSGESYQTVSGVNFGVDGEVRLSGRPACGPSPYDHSKGKFLFYYDLLDASDVDIYVYDISGTLVWQKTLPYDAGTSGAGGSAGTNRVYWDGENSFGETLGNGAYLYMIVAQDSGQKKVIGRGKFAVIGS